MTWVGTLRARVESHPDRRAVELSLEGDSVDATLTYGDLDRRARAIAGRLQQRAVPGDRAVLLYPAGPEFLSAFLGCMYAGVVAVPIPPPTSSRSEQFNRRFRAVHHDARPVAGLTLSSILASAGAAARPPRRGTTRRHSIGSPPTRSSRAKRTGGMRLRFGTRPWRFFNTPQGRPPSRAASGFITATCATTSTSSPGRPATTWNGCGS